LLAPAWGGDAAPLHERIDQLIEAQAGGPLAAQASDAEFLRRVTLDFAGRIPTADELRAFLADTSADNSNAKRTAVVDKLLASDEYPRRMQQVFHVMLMERLGDHEEWSKYLHDSFAANKPWDQMCREMMNPNPDDEATRGAALFFTKRLENYGQNPVDVPALVRDVGRLLMGIDVQCCQCHDHLFVDDYKQEYYQGLFAFVGQTYIRKDLKFPAVGEKPLTKKVEFMSVFIQKPKAIGPKLPGIAEVSLPEFKAGEEYEIPPDKKTKFPGKPKFSALQVLAEQLPTADNRLFSHNIANRLWWLMMGRGLVHPLDLQNTENAPSHPEVLELISHELAAHQFDMKWLLRELALSRTYQRSGVAEFALETIPPQSYRVALEKPLSSEQLLASMLRATGEYEQTKGDAKKLTALQAHFDKAFANPPREPEVEHSPSVKAALFLLNDDTVIGWLAPGKENLTARLAKIDDSDKLAEELYASVLSRLPTAEERAEVAAFLKSHGDRRDKAIENLAWALLASSEFCTNH
jgi:hypothetical protein